MARLEHLNITVRDPDDVADKLCTLLDWAIRWSGPAMSNGRTVHVGTATAYVALFRPPGEIVDRVGFGIMGAVNHIGVEVDDLDATETLARSLGYGVHSHADYEPGRRFYIDGPEGIEIEVVSYA